MPNYQDPNDPIYDGLRSEMQALSGVEERRARLMQKPIASSQDAALAVQAEKEHGYPATSMLTPASREVLAAHKLAPLAERLEGSKVAEWATSHPIHPALIQNSLESVEAVNARAIAADEARVAFENKDKSIAAGLLAQLGGAAANIVTRAPDVGKTILNRILPGGAATAIGNAWETGLNITTFGALGGARKLKAYTDTKQVATESVFVKDPVTGQEVLNLGAMNPLTKNGAVNILSMVAGELPDTAATVGIGLLTGGTGAVASEAAVAATGKVGAITKLYKTAKAVKKFYTSPVALNTMARTVQGQAESGVKEFMAKGYTEEEARQKTAGGALLAGMFSLAAGAPMEAKFLEDNLRRVATTPWGVGFANKARRVLTDFVTTGSKEALQEVAEGLGEDLAEKLTYNPDKSAKEFAANIFSNAVGGFAVGGVTGTSLNLASGNISQRYAEQKAFIQSIHDEKLRAEFTKAAPAKWGEMLEAITKDGPAENLPVDSAKFKTYFQSQGMDPKTVAVETLGIKPEDYDVVDQHGGDLIVPIKAYGEHIAGTEHFEAIKNATRPDVGSPTFGEIRDSEMTQEAELAVEEAIKSLPAIDPTRDTIKAAMAAEIKGATGVLRASEAETLADHFAKVVMVQAERAGMEPMDLFNRYKPQFVKASKDSIKQLDEFKAVLTRAQGGEIQDGKLQGYDKGSLEHDILTALQASYNEDMGMSFVPDAMSLLEADYGREAVHAAMLAMVRKRNIELRPESGMGRLTPEQLASAPMANESPLTWARPLNKSGDPYTAAAGQDGTSATQAQPDAQPEAQIQPTGTERGFIRVSDLDDSGSRKIQIHLLENENRSTVFHELGHLYLEMLGDLSAKEGVDDGLKKDFQKVLDWFGVKDRSEITVEMSEKFADAHLVYLKEGKAPDAELIPAFQKFSTWLAKLGKKLLGVEVNLTDEVRGIFDRLYATDQEIEEAKREIGYYEISGIDKLNISETEREALKKSSEKHVAKAKATLLEKVMADFAKQDKKEYKELKRATTEAAKAEVAERPEYKALDALMKGDPGKLDKDSLVRGFGKGILSRLPGGKGKHSVYLREGGYEPSALAEALGYESGEALIQALDGLPSPAKAVQKLLDAKMQEAEPDILRNKEQLRADAIEYLSTGEGRVQHLAAELRALNRTAAQAAPLVAAARAIAAQEARDVELGRAELEADARAEERAAEAVKASRRKEARTFQEIQAYKDAARVLVERQSAWKIDPNTYKREMKRASRESYSKALSDRYEEAAKAKEQEIFYSFAYQYALDLQREGKAFEAYIKRSDSNTTRDRMKKAGGSYLAYFDQVRDKNGVPRKSLGENVIPEQGALEWLNSLGAKGQDIAPWVVDVILAPQMEDASYKDLAAGDMRDLKDAMENIKHLALLEQTVLTNEGRVEKAQAIQELSEGMLKVYPVYTQLYSDTDSKGAEERNLAVAAITSIDKTLRKMQSLINRLDGNDVNGPWHRYVWNPISKAAYLQADLERDLLTPLIQLENAAPRREREEASIGRFDIGLKYETGKPRLVSQNELFTMLLYQGQADRKEKLAGGYAAYGLNQSMIDAAFKHLPDSMLAKAEAIWGTFDKMKPAVMELEKRQRGVNVEWQKASPVVVRDADGNVRATLSGGYFPLVKDAVLAPNVKALIGSESLTSVVVNALMGRATTSTSHVKDLDSSVYPLSLNYMNTVSVELEAQIHDLTHREALLSIDKLLSDPTLAKLMKNHVGEAAYSSFRPWLLNIATDKVPWNLDGTEKALDYLRTGVMKSLLGFKLTSGLVQVVDNLRVLAPGDFGVSPKHWFVALAKFTRDRSGYAEFVNNASGMMRNRGVSYTRDMREEYAASRKLRRSSVGGNLLDMWRNTPLAFALFKYMDAQVSYTAWLASYDQAMEEHADHDRAVLEADRTVELRVGAGQAKDQSKLMANKHPAMKILTMFGGDAAATYTLLENLYRNLRANMTPKNAALAVAGLLFVAGSAIVSGMIKGQPPEDEEDFKKWILAEAATSPFNAVPFMIRDIGRYMADKASGKNLATMRPSPIVIPLEKVSSALLKPFSEEEIMWDEYTLEAAEAAIYAGGLPGAAQLKASSSYLRRYNEGEEQPDNAAELVYKTVMGAPKQR